jgi:class 3 adenylate cyclase
MTADESTPASATQPMERRLATILCADVAGYSRLMGENEERTVRVFRGHKQLFESLVAMHRGRMFGVAGDMLLAEFNSAVEAVRCATEIQAALRTRNEQLTPDEKMQFRIGINLGDVIVQGPDLLGDGVNVAARIQSATEPGGICISGSVHDQIQNKLSLSFKLLGEQSYKNIAKPVRTYTIAEGAAVTAPKKRPARRIAAAGAVLALAGAAYLGYRLYEQSRVEQARVQAELAAQKQAVERAQSAAEEAKRDAQRRAADAPKALRSVEHNGTYGGRLCNEFRSGAPQCWPAILVVRDGVIESSWRSVGDRTSSASGTLRSDGSVELKLAGWTRSGKPNEATLSGRIAEGTITASGSWLTGGKIAGTWTHGQSFAAAPAAAGRSGQLETMYDGKLCMPRRNSAPNCWPVALSMREGVIEGVWLGRMNKTARASGRLAADGSLRLKLFAWRRDGTPIDGTLSGRMRGDAIEASGHWSDKAEISGSWRRKI